MSKQSGQCVRERATTTMKMYLHALIVLLAASSDAFTISAPSQRRQSNSAAIFMTSTTTTEADPLGLPAELRKITDAFNQVGDDSMRHKQLLYMADQLPKISPEKCTPENKVPGCLSTVFVDGTARWDDEKQEYVIDYVGECDGLLTKGLVALLARYVFHFILSFLRPCSLSLIPHSCTVEDCRGRQRKRSNQ